jgi:putative DNA primase/helicase
LLQQACNFTPKQSFDFVANWLGLKGFDSVQPRINSAVTPAQKRSNESDAELRAKAKYLWDSGSSIQAGDTVDLYLRKRGINLDKYPEVLRFHPRLKHYPESPDERTTYPGMLAKLTAPDGTFGGCLRTFLLETGVKAFGKQSKKFMRGAVPVGSAIHLYEPTNILGIGEGVETCLTCPLALGIPVWATGGTVFMEKTIIPAEVKEVVILADHDEHRAGLKSAHVLARRLIKENRTVKILTPPATGDWLDVVASISR